MSVIFASLPKPGTKYRSIRRRLSDSQILHFLFFLPKKKIVKTKIIKSTHHCFIEKGFFNRKDNVRIRDNSDEELPTSF